MARPAINAKLATKALLRKLWESGEKVDSYSDVSVTKIKSLYFASFFTENLNSFNVPERKFYVRAQTSSSGHLWYSRYCWLVDAHKGAGSKPGNLVPEHKC